MGVVGYHVDKRGRHPTPKKVKKIVDWPACSNPREVRMFIGICVYYRIWVKNFAVVAAPLFDLLRKDMDFHWTIEAQKSMEELKTHITSALALISIDYSELLKPVIILVDGSGKGWGAVLQQTGPMGY
jgi:hypothetical protein